MHMLLKDGRVENAACGNTMNLLRTHNVFDAHLAGTLLALLSCRGHLRGISGQAGTELTWTLISVSGCRSTNEFSALL